MSQSGTLAIEDKKKNQQHVEIFSKTQALAKYTPNPCK